ncbi:hypothetical protein DYB35_009606 [Aphanomyces astaci]|uniref:malate dehydrogenase n=1 Tax=Aphanomyces astaci TaxID=112090 RepID=A0A418DQL7_APHAT|nr:hypothetical protein DYB35_009606 [Aphanomyces astaci]
MTASSATPLNVVVSGAAGQVAYAFLPLLCSGRVLGPNQRIHLRLLDIPQSLEVLGGVVMELNDCAFHLVDDIVPMTDLETAFENADIAILLGGFPRKQGMEREHKHVSSKDVRNCVIWGNHSNTQVPDAAHVVIQSADGSVAPLADFLQDSDWIDSSLRPLVQNRGAAIIKARKLSSAMSVGAAIAGHMNDWLFGSSELVSMAILSTGNKYGVPDDLIYSFPVKCLGHGEYQVANVAVSPAIAKLMQVSTDELQGEKVEAFSQVDNSHV